MVHLGADAVADVLLDDPVVVAVPLARRDDAVLDRRAHGIQATRPTRERGDAGPHGVLGGVDEGEVLGAAGVAAADDDRDGGVAVPAVDDRAAVDRDEVALGAAPADPGCRARPRR